MDGVKKKHMHPRPRLLVGVVALTSYATAKKTTSTQFSVAQDVSALITSASLHTCALTAERRRPTT